MQTFVRAMSDTFTSRCSLMILMRYSSGSPRPTGKPAGKPQTLKTGPNAGKRVVYVRDPDGTTIEFMQPPMS